MKMINKILSVFCLTIYKKWRLDLGFWESKKTIFWFIRYYKYEVWEKGLVKSKYSIACEQKNTANYFVFKELSKITIGKKEFEDKYKNNKWLVPLNLEVDVNLP